MSNNSPHAIPTWALWFLGGGCLWAPQGGNQNTCRSRALSAIAWMWSHTAVIASLLASNLKERFCFICRWTRSGPSAWPRLLAGRQPVRSRRTSEHTGLPERCTAPTLFVKPLVWMTIFINSPIQPHRQCSECLGIMTNEQTRFICKRKKEMLSGTEGHQRCLGFEEGVEGSSSSSKASTFVDYSTSRFPHVMGISVCTIFYLARFLLPVRLRIILEIVIP